MRVLDKQGRLFGRVSVIDLLLVLTVLGLGLSYVYQRTSGDIQQIIKADKTFYVTFAVERIRPFLFDAVAEGDLFFRRNDRQALGEVVKVGQEPAKILMNKTDGTAILAPMEDRYVLYVTLACTGSITDTGHHINGNIAVTNGSTMAMQSNRLYLDTYVYAISDVMP